MSDERLYVKTLLKVSITEAEDVAGEDDDDDEDHPDDLDIRATTPNAESIGGESAVEGGAESMDVEVIHGLLTRLTIGWKPTNRENLLTWSL